MKINIPNGVSWINNMTNWNNKNNGRNHHHDSFWKKRKVPFKHQLRNVVFLLKHTFKILWRNKDITCPTMASIYYSVVVRILFFAMLGSFFIEPLLWIVLVIIWIIATVYKFFYFAKQKSNQSYLVFNTITWNNISYKDSSRYIQHDFNKYRSIAFIDLIKWYIENSNNRQRTWIKWIIVGGILSWLEEILDLISNYLLPAMVIENKSISAVKDDLKEVKDNVPQALVWVFWIDFLGSAVNILLWFVYIVMICLGGLIGWGMWFVSDTLIITIWDHYVSFLPLLIFIIIISIISVIILRWVDAVKVIYFTIFYTSIMKSENIIADLRDDLNSYLIFQEVDTQKTE